MLGAIIGDIVGSRFEWHNIKTKQFDLLTHSCFFTDARHGLARYCSSL